MDFDALNRRLLALVITIKLMEILGEVRIVQGKQFNGYSTNLLAHLHYS